MVQEATEATWCVRRNGAQHVRQRRLHLDRRLVQVDRPQKVCEDAASVRAVRGRHRRVAALGVDMHQECSVALHVGQTESAATADGNSYASACLLCGCLWIYRPC